jgi:hypothetical protein
LPPSDLGRARTLSAMESENPSDPPQVHEASETPAASPTGRDPDLVALEGFESEFAELETELERVERTADRTS